MTAAHLRAVPDSDDETPGPEDWPVPVPTTVAPRPPADDEDQEQPPTPDNGGEDPAEDGGVEDEKPRGWMPDLRPYYDPRPLAELGPIVVQVCKNGGPPLLRAIWASLRFLSRGIGALLVILGRGIGVLLVLLAGYLSGKLGKRGSIGARFCAAGFAAYAVVKLSTEYPAFPWFVLAALLPAVILAGLGHVPVPDSQPAKQGAAKKKGRGEKGKKNALKVKAAPAKNDGEGDLEEDDDPSPDAAEEAADEPPAETPRDPSPEDVIRALHHLYKGGSGVLHTALVQHLGLADTRAVKRVLDEASIPYRPGVRTPAGNGPGVHHHDFPPRPPAQESAEGASVVAGQPANANANNAANSAGEVLEAESGRWLVAELAQGFRFVRDLERGPTSWKIEYRGKS